MQEITALALGDSLRAAREERSLSIEETAWRTRMRPDLLRALEREDFEVVGPPGTVRRSLHSYARFLGMNPKVVLARLEALHGEVPSAIEELDRADRTAKRPPRAKWLVAAGLCSALLAAGSVVGVLGGQGERTPRSTFVTDEAVAAPRLKTGAASRSRTVAVSLRFVVVRESNVRVLVDGVQMFDGIVSAGTSKAYTARSTVDIIAADGSALRITVNGVEYDTGVSRAPLRARFGPRGRIVS